jgi:1-acyl-sn-glycerol-3-phosphate acyltransferase
VDELRAGELVGVFPEATMSRSMEPKAFKSGAVRMAAEAGTPVVPVAVWGTQRLYCYDKRSRIAQLGVPVEMHVGTPLDPGGDPDEVTARLRSAIIGLVRDAQRDYPQDGAGQWWQPARLGGTAPPPEFVVD